MVSRYSFADLGTDAKLFCFVIQISERKKRRKLPYSFVINSISLLDMTSE